MKTVVIPTVLEKSKKGFSDRLKRLQPFAKIIHVDIMDGRFVHEKSLEIKDLPAFHDHIHVYEAHLMVEHPQTYISALKEKGFSKAIFHYEAMPSDWKTAELMQVIRANGMFPVLALNPETDVSKALPFIHESDTVLLMAVNPGREHQSIDEGIYNKIRKLRNYSKNVKIQVDGGVNPSTAKKLKEAGADFINSGSYVSGAKNPEKAMKELQEAFGRDSK